MSTVTMVAIDFAYHDLTQYAVERSLDAITPAEVLTISDRPLIAGARHVQHLPVSGMPEYANLMLKGVAEHVTTSHALYVQWDGIAYRPELWTDDYLQYDYIGAPWPWGADNRKVGNGGFSLRSKRLLDICASDPLISLTEQEPIAEDNIIAVHNRAYLEEQYSIRFAPLAVAEQFSFELGHMRNSFGFHGLWNVIAQMTDADVEYYLPRINYKGWNVYKWNHVLNAASRRSMDVYTYLLDQLIVNSPDLLPLVSGHIERSSNDTQTQFL